MERLQEIGWQLDRGIFPEVLNGGIVVPNTNPDLLLNLGEDKNDERERTRRPETQPWEWPKAGQWPACGRRQADTATSVIGKHLETEYDREIGDLLRVYPDAKIWRQPEGMWLLVNSDPVPEHLNKALFVIWVPFIWPSLVKGWGFWTGGFLREPFWIGPRHTNFPDGSICAFEITDGTWKAGDSLITLLDLYSLWALRHLHLETFGRWPGYQHVKHPHERLCELREDELCGCGLTEKLYGECCRSNDLARDRVADVVEFRFLTGGKRLPPDKIVKFACLQTTPPNYINFHY